MHGRHTGVQPDIMTCAALGVFWVGICNRVREVAGFFEAGGDHGTTYGEIRLYVLCGKVFDIWREDMILYSCAGINPIS